jgi:hypothetical protein
MEEMDTNPELPGGIPTLLNIPGRKELPPIPNSMGRSCKLVDLVQLTPGVYENIMANIRKGCYPHLSAEAAGIPTGTFYRWGTRGKEDFKNMVDSYYSRFYLDVRKAIAQCRVAIEQTVAVIDPKKWLERGPGKIFGEEWGAVDDGSASIPVDQTFIEEKEQLKIETTGVEIEVIRLDSATEEATKKVLREVLDRKGD